MKQALLRISIEMYTRGLGNFLVPFFVTNESNLERRGAAGGPEVAPRVHGTVLRFQLFSDVFGRSVRITETPMSAKAIVVVQAVVGRRSTQFQAHMMEVLAGPLPQPEKMAIVQARATLVLVVTSRRLTVSFGNSRHRA